MYLQVFEYLSNSLEIHKFRKIHKKLYKDPEIEKYFNLCNKLNNGLKKNRAKMIILLKNCDNEKDKILIRKNFYKNYVENFFDKKYNKLYKKYVNCKYAFCKNAFNEISQNTLHDITNIFQEYLDLHNNKNNKSKYDKFIIEKTNNIINDKTNKQLIDIII